MPTTDVLQAALTERVNGLLATAGVTDSEASGCSKLYNRLCGSGPLTAARLAALAADKGLPEAQQEAMNAVHAKHDTDKKGTWGLHEFAGWWNHATDAASVLLRNALVEPQLPSVQAEVYALKGPEARVDVTVGKVGPDFTPGTAVYANVTPSTADVLKSVVEELQRRVAPAQKPSKKIAANVNAIAAEVHLSVRREATEEEVQEVQDIFKAVTGELIANSPAASKLLSSLALTLEHDGPSGRTLRLQAVITPPAQKTSKSLRRLRDLITYAGVHEESVFGQVSVGIELGGDSAAAFSPIAQGAALDTLLSQGVRATVLAQATSGTASLVEAFLGLEDSAAEQRLFASLLLRGIGSVKTALHLESSKDMLDSLVDRLARIPLQEAIKAGASEEQLKVAAGLEETLRMRLRAIAAAATASFSDTLFSNDVVEKIFGRIPGGYRNVFVIGDRAPATEVARSLGATTPGGATAGLQFLWKDKTAFAVTEWDHAAVASTVESDHPHFIFVLDASSPAAALKSCERTKAFMGLNRVTLGSAEAVFVIVGSAVPQAVFVEEVGTLTEQFGRTWVVVDAVPSAITGTTPMRPFTADPTSETTPLEAFFDFGSEDEDGDAGGEDEEGEDENGGVALIRTVLNAVPKVVEGITLVSATTDLLDVSIELVKAPIFSLLRIPEPAALARARVEAAVRSSVFSAARLSMEAADGAEVLTSENASEPSDGENGSDEAVDNIRNASEPGDIRNPSEPGNDSDSD